MFTCSPESSCSIWSIQMGSSSCRWLVAPHLSGTRHSTLAVTHRTQCQLGEAFFSCSQLWLQLSKVDVGRHLDSGCLWPVIDPCHLWRANRKCVLQLLKSNSGARSRTACRPRPQNPHCITTQLLTHRWSCPTRLGPHKRGSLGRCRWFVSQP